MDERIPKAYLYMVGMMVAGGAIEYGVPTERAQHWAKVITHNGADERLRLVLAHIYSATEEAMKYGYLQNQLAYIDRYPGFEWKNWKNTRSELIAISPADRLAALREIYRLHKSLSDSGRELSDEEYVNQFFAALAELDVDEDFVNEISELPWYQYLDENGAAKMDGKNPIWEQRRMINKPEMGALSWSPKFGRLD